MRIRHAEPDDHARVVAVVDDWWGGRAMADMLPHLFFVHFRETSFVAEEDGELAGFLCGFLSQTFADEAYVHFVGVNPAFRGRGVDRALYERLYEAIAPRTVVRCVTSPVNEASVAFHSSIGFEVERVAPDYDGRGGDRVLLVKRLQRQPPLDAACE
ncbi:MAG: N-acetyltransferase family protein [Gaiellaceae bacterium]